MSDKTDDILISIVIPVKNGDYWLRQTLEAITGQTIFARCEVIIIDSGSTDRTFEILKDFPVRIIRIPSGEFNHGATRNLGVSEATGKYVVMTVQDATPSDERWLENLLAGFEDEHVAGVCGQQVVPHDKGMNPVSWFRPYSEPTLTKIVYPSPEAFHQASPAEKKRATGWDDVNAMYRRDILLRIPFRRMIFGEDAQWAVDALLAGYCIVYNDNAKVYHYHHDRPDGTYKRMFSACYIRYKLAGFVYPTDGFRSLLTAAKILSRAELSLKEKIRWFRYNYRNRIAVNKAIKDFNKLAARGEQCVEESYSRICAAPPAAIKPTATI